MGIWERMNDSFREKLGREFQFVPPQEDGCDTVETIKQMHEGRIRLFFGMGGNFLVASPDTEYTSCTPSMPASFMAASVIRFGSALMSTMVVITTLPERGAH